MGVADCVEAGSGVGIGVGVGVGTVTESGICVRNEAWVGVVVGVSVAGGAKVCVGDGCP